MLVFPRLLHLRPCFMIVVKSSNSQAAKGLTLHTCLKFFSRLILYPQTLLLWKLTGDKHHLVSILCRNKVASPRIFNGTIYRVDNKWETNLRQFCKVPENTPSWLPDYKTLLNEYIMYLYVWLHSKNIALNLIDISMSHCLNCWHLLDMNDILEKQHWHC